ncbi:hypothetical protein K2173_011372 [Erythroxylum novogranatense]|uniref:DNA endonuclease activator Ctp1 C-terminal domain-containing protein n=1 Tax=Erythroxylum novogranatense TaxID=1862640 RepID=A0AAV8S9X5_9ROSI|nr:hypothetical protein K2173_011372 [Erythroxylum novogranatense]
MEKKLSDPTELELESSLDNGDEKYVYELSTVLVGTIQDAKDRISQIEYIFCNQLYPIFLSKSKRLQNFCSEAKKQTDDIWRRKENDLLLQIQKLELQMKQVIEENHYLKIGKEKLPEDIRIHQIIIDEHERKLLNKSKEVDEGIDLQVKLQNMVQTKDSLIVEKEKQLKEHEDAETRLLAKVESLEREIEELQHSLRRERETVADKEEKGQNLVRHLNKMISYLGDSGAKLTEREKQNEELVRKLESAEENVSHLQAELKKKIEELDKGKALQTQLQEQLDGNVVKISKQKQQLEESENDRKLLMDRVQGLSEMLKDLQNNPTSCSDKVAEGKDSHKKSLQEIELKSSQLLQAEKKKRSVVVEAYKRLKSRYNFLCTKFGLTRDNVLGQGQSENGCISLNHQQNLSTSTDGKNKELHTCGDACETKKPKLDSGSSVDMVDKVVVSVPVSKFNSPTSGFIAPKCPPTSKSAPISSGKRPASSWIDTRSVQCKDGNDPHDDFLQTPLENIKNGLIEAMKEEVQYLPDKKDANPDCRDEETKDINAEPSREEKEQIQDQLVVNKSFKYVESVRKKAARESLKGVECNQCTKFYDAVLPNNGGREADGNKHNCEHHDGVSRHRYKYIPPMTPEGFWNIGFESEM